MKSGLTVAVVFALALVVVMPHSAFAQRGAPAGEVLTNQSVIGMTSAKLNKDILLAKINTTRNGFDVTVNGVIGLYQSKVNTDVIRSMITLAADPKLGQSSKATEVLTNDSIVTMVIAKLPRPLVTAKIHNTKANFDVSASGLVSLAQSKVHAEIIKAMVAKAGGEH